MPHCDDEVWSMHDKEKKNNILSYIQRALVGASTAVALVADELMKASTSKGKKDIPLKHLLAIFRPDLVTIW